MKAIGTAGYEQPKSVDAGAAPLLEWLPISDLVIDSAYRPPVRGKGRRNVERIAGSFSWSRFATVVVAPVEGGRFTIIDGRQRTTAAALAGFDKVPCQIVTASREEQAQAFKAINGCGIAASRMALHVADVGASDPLAVRVTEACTRAQVELLRYPVPIDRQSAGQTMAVGAIARCLKRYGDETLITALQCVTQTTNNRPGALSARTIKALCAVLGSDPVLRDSGLVLFEIFDGIDLIGLANAAEVDAAVIKINPVQAMADRIRLEINRRVARKATGFASPKQRLEALRKSRVGIGLRSQTTFRGSPAMRAQKP